MAEQPHDDGITEYLYKVLVIGDIGTGKTSIIKRYVHNVFSMHYKATIGVDFALKVINLNNCIVRLQLWDIAGQERFGNMTRVYYKEAVGALIVFDISRESTFEAVQKWKSDLDQKVRLPGHEEEPIPVVLVANKCDLAKQGTCQDPNKMAAYWQENGFCGYAETSAKDNVGIDDAVMQLVKAILKKEPSEQEKRQTVPIVQPAPQPTESCPC